MPRMGQRVVDRSTYLAPLDGWFTRAMMSGDQQQDTVAEGNRLLKPTVDGGPCGVEVQSVQVEHPVRLDRTTAQPFVPASVECLLTHRAWLWFRRCGTWIGHGSRRDFGTSSYGRRPRLLWLLDRLS